MQKDRFRSFMD